MRRLIAAGLVLAVAACSGPSATVGPTAGPATPGATDAASLPPVATVEPTASAVPPTAEPSIPPVGSQTVFLPGSAIEVSVNELNLRKKPSTDSKRLEILNRGQVLVVSPSDNISIGWGPVKADGYTWYPVIQVDVESTDSKLDPLPKYPIPLGAEPNAGWVASDDGDQPFVVAIAPRCPTTIDLLNVSGMLPAERIACFGPAPFVLEGTFGCSGCGGIALGTYKPVWLATPFEFDFLSVAPEDRFGPLALRFPPDGPDRPANGTIIRVTVHVDDPRSTKCTIKEGDGAGGLLTVDSETALYYCRERLVVESYDVLGTDPDFPDF